MSGRRTNSDSFLITTREDGSRGYYTHDDRAESSRRSFHPPRGGRWNGPNGHRGRGVYRGNRTYHRGSGQDAEDDSKNDETTNRHQSMYARGRGGNKHRRTMPVFWSGWSKVLVKNFEDATPEQIISTLKSNVESDFTPFKAALHGKAHFYFYLDRDQTAVSSLIGLSNRLTIGSSTSRLVISVIHANPPFSRLNDQEIAVVERVMGKRYSAETNSINLSNFHRDPELIAAAIYCPLDNYVASTMVIGIIQKNIPNIREIDFTNNKLTTLKGMEGLQKLENLQKLTFHMNRIFSVHHLIKLRGLGISELVLKSSILSQRCGSREAYISALRKHFPKLAKLDDEPLPKVIGFELDEPSKLPTTKPSFYCSEQAKTLVLQFIDQYYQVYESASRRPLEAAYTEEAKLSVTLSQGIRDKTMNVYSMKSRNLLDTLDSDVRHVNLIRGRVNILDLLCSLPTCSHDPRSFVVDIPMAQPELVHVGIRGVFRTDSATPATYAFMRSLIIVPVGNGFCISNEQISITIATQIQKETIFNEKEVVKTVAPPQPQDLTDVQKNMLTQFAVNSKMLPQFSRECLENNAWDFNKAAAMFVALKQENKIPAEYYDNSMC